MDEPLLAFDGLFDDVLNLWIESETLNGYDEKHLKLSNSKGYVCRRFYYPSNDYSRMTAMTKLLATLVFSKSIDVFLLSYA